MKLKPRKAGKDFDKDQKMFEQLPSKTKELELLRDQAEKAIGQESVSLQKSIRDKSKQ